MTGISLDMVAHELNLNPKKNLVSKKMRHHTLEKQAAIEEEVKKPLEARFIREEKFPLWLANVCGLH